MSDTPRTDAEEMKDDPKGYGPSYAGLVDADFARTLERELAEAKRLRFEADAGRRADRHAAQRELAAAMAEITRLNDYYSDEAVKLRRAKDELAAVTAERDRLRAALDTIANPRRGTPEEHWDVGEIGDYARAALEKEQQ